MEHVLGFVALAAGLAQLRELEKKNGYALLENLGHGAMAGDGLAHLRDRGEAHVPAAQTFYRRPLAQGLRQVSHRQHAVREYVIHSGGAGEVAVDMRDAEAIAVVPKLRRIR